MLLVTSGDHMTSLNDTEVAVLERAGVVTRKTYFGQEVLALKPGMRMWEASVILVRGY